MVFDTQEQKNIILEMINALTIPGKNLDLFYFLKQQVLSAEIKKNPEPPKKP